MWPHLKVKLTKQVDLFCYTSADPLSSDDLHKEKNPFALILTGQCWRWVIKIAKQSVFTYYVTKNLF